MKQLFKNTFVLQTLVIMFWKILLQQYKNFVSNKLKYNMKPNCSFTNFNKKFISIN